MAEKWTGGSKSEEEEYIGPSGDSALTMREDTDSRPDKESLGDSSTGLPSASDDEEGVR
jgi:hypothetical protein